MVDNSYVITVFDPAFRPIPWMQDGVVYQIFPDRFRNDNAANDPTATEPRYRYPGNVEDKIVKKSWNSLPEGFCHKYQNPATPCAEGPRGRDYFGGDLKGVQDKLGYLQSLGVTIIYFNPIFEAASNHLYDTRDYKTIDPFFGTEQDWDNLVTAANAQNIKIVLDGVFNHVSSDSINFDRYGHFAQVGACEDVNLPYRSWFYCIGSAGCAPDVSSNGLALGVEITGISCTICIVRSSATEARITSANNCLGTIRYVELVENHRNIVAHGLGAEC